jgi:hypothetical protein
MTSAPPAIFVPRAIVQAIGTKLVSEKICAEVVDRLSILDHSLRRFEHEPKYYMINIDKIRAGMIATVILNGEHKMNKRNNPLAGRVTRNHRLVVTVAGPDSYRNALAQRGEEPAGKTPWFQWERDGVVRSVKTGQLYLAALPTGAKREANYLVDNRPATESELATIRQFTSEKGKPEFLCFALENVQNVA